MERGLLEAIYFSPFSVLLLSLLYRVDGKEDEMNSRFIWSSAMFIFLLLSLVGQLILVHANAESNVIYVDVSNFNDPNEDGSLEHPFDMIMEGVDAAGPADIIQVAAGVYHEYVAITKSFISLQGVNGTIIDGDGSRNGIRVGAPPSGNAENVSIRGITVRNCVKGVVLVRCRYVSLRDVVMVNNSYNFADYSLLLQNDIDISNRVDGKPIYYWVNQRDKQVPADAGFVALINCTNMVVKGLNLTRNGQGVLLKYTNNSLVEGLNIVGNWDGVYIDAWSSNNTVADCIVKDNLFMGVYVSKSTDNVAFNNTVSGNQYGVFLDESTTGTLIANNIIAGNEDGLYFFGENGVISKNVIHANTVSNNTLAVSLFYSRDNIFYHNNFINNANLFHFVNSAETWDYDGEGNFWSDYNGTDVFSGLHQNDTGSDGIGDTPYLIDENNRDNYPIVGLFAYFIVEWCNSTYYVLVISNSTVSKFSFIQQDKLVCLDVTGSGVASGFCRINLPNILLGGPYTIFVNEAPPANLVETSNGTHSFFYVSYGPGIHEIKIKGTTVIPEFSSFLLALFFFSALGIVQFTRVKKKFSSGPPIVDKFRNRFLNIWLGQKTNNAS
jgi:parallel beta-helix repeat protein